MQRFDLHMHTKYCDGNNTVAEMVQAAADLGLEAVGISGHAYTAHDDSYCMNPASTEEYLKDIREAEEKFGANGSGLKVLAGLEMDYYTDEDGSRFDYTIGSVHYIMDGDEWAAVDETPEALRAFAEDCFGGDRMAVAERYFETVGDVVNRTGCDIIGHFDLITKFVERDPELFDTESPRYVAAWKAAVDKIFEDTAAKCEAGLGNRLFDVGDKPVFEINTGAISRGYRTSPYPSAEQMEYIKSKGGYLVLDSDSHSADNIGFKFEEFADWADELELKK